MMQQDYSSMLRRAAGKFRPEAFDAVFGTVACNCPSNIAIVKYWGKRPVQIPMNPSLSMTLEEARTATEVSFRFEPGIRTAKRDFTYGGKASVHFADRVTLFLTSLEPLLPWLASTSLQIDSQNTFPHSSGIASSASAMGALAICLLSIEEKITGETEKASRLKKASFIARLGSGSASRSVYPAFALWGNTPDWTGSSNQFAIPLKDFHPAFEGARDSILVVDSGQKSISSSSGHALMEDHPYAAPRFERAHQNISALKRILESGDWPAFINMLEEEALSLHALMMTSRPGYLLMKPGTLSILEKVRRFREETGLTAGFTLDAGANVHLIYPSGQEQEVRDFIDGELLRHCQDNMVIHDRMGKGPETLTK